MEIKYTHQELNKQRNQSIYTYLKKEVWDTYTNRDENTT